MVLLAQIALIQELMTFQKWPNYVCVGDMAEWHCVGLAGVKYQVDPCQAKLFFGFFLLLVLKAFVFFFSTSISALGKR